MSSRIIFDWMLDKFRIRDSVGTVYDGYATMTDNTDTTTVTTGGDTYVIQGTFTNSLNGFTAVDGGIRCNNPIEEEYIINYSYTFTCSSPNEIIYFGAQVLNGEVTCLHLKPVFVKTAGESYTVSGICKPTICENAVLSLITSADDDGAVITVTDAEVYLRKRYR